MQIVGFLMKWLICSVKAMLLLIKCKYRILEKFKPPHKKATENGDIHHDKSGESDGLIEGEEKTVVDMDMEIDTKVSITLLYHAPFFCDDHDGFIYLQIGMLISMSTASVLVCSSRCSACKFLL